MTSEVFRPGVTTRLQVSGFTGQFWRPFIYRVLDKSGCPDCFGGLPSWYGPLETTIECYKKVEILIKETE